MIKKLCAIVAAVLCFSGAGISSAGAISTHSSVDSAARTALPFHGHYAGHDAHGRAVRFSFFGNQMQNFHVNHTFFGHAHVSGDRWHHTCHNGLCTRGQWVTDTRVDGVWNDSNSGHHVMFVAHLVSH